MPFRNARPDGMPVDVLTGFLSPLATPTAVGAAIDHAGALLVAGDVGNVICRVVPADGSP